MVLVFKTSVRDVDDAAMIRPALDHILGPSAQWSFDLEDIDNIFRVVQSPLPENEIQSLFHRFGFECEALEDVVPNTTAPFDSGSTTLTQRLRVRLRFRFECGVLEDVVPACIN